MALVIKVQSLLAVSLMMDVKPLQWDSLPAIYSRPHVLLNATLIAFL